MYEISNEIYEGILREMEEVLEERDYDYNTDALRSILNTWLERKQNLLEMLSKHPNWDAERLMVKFDTDYCREINTDQTVCMYQMLINNTNANNYTCTDSKGWHYSLGYDILYVMLSMNTYIPEDDASKVEALNSMHENFRFRVGMKSTKVMRKICETFGWDKITGTEYDIHGNLVTFNKFERVYAKYCDALCPIKVTRHTCISLNPIDFLLMSHGNSWDSCHYIGDYSSDAGCYSSGTISYMLDEHSFIFYTVSSDFDGVEIETEPKIQRQVFGYNDSQLLQSRLYPQCNDYSAEVQYTDIRNIVQKVVADCCEKPNLWVKRKVGNNVKKGRYATVYDDWYHFSNLCSVSVLKEVAESEHIPLVMGAQPMCIECGNYHTTDNNINCCYKEYHCVCCGEELNEDDVRWVGDNPCCSDCATYCDECEHYDYESNVRWVERYDRYVCDDCLERYYRWCDECESYVLKEECTYVESVNGYICDDCLEEYFEKCAECGEYHLKHEMIDVVDDETGEIKLYCVNCHEKAEEAC